MAAVEGVLILWLDVCQLLVHRNADWTQALLISNEVRMDCPRG